MLRANEVVVGVDGGTTKTIALIARTTGDVLGWARGPGSNLYGEGENAVATIAATVAKAAHAAGIEPLSLAAGGFSLAGADWKEDIAYLEERLLAQRLGHQVRVVNDSVGALYASCAQGDAVVAVCGGGFTVSARSATGSLWYGGHWTDWSGGHKRGDLGGRSMAGAAMRAVVDQELAIGPPTALTAEMLSHFGVSDVTELLHVFTARQGRPPSMLDEITCLLLSSANAGDAVALGIVRDFGEAMGDVVLAAARKVAVQDSAFDLALFGGVLRQDCPSLHAALLETVRRGAPRFRTGPSPFEPAHGAVLLALETLAGPSTGAVKAKLLRSSPPSALFGTRPSGSVALSSCSGECRCAISLDG